MREADESSVVGETTATKTGEERKEVFGSCEMDGKPLTTPMFVLFVFSVLLIFVALAVLLPLLWPLHVATKALNNSRGGRRSVAFSPIEAFNIALGKYMCWGLGVRIARVGTENFVDERGSRLKVSHWRGTPSKFIVLYNHTSNLDPPVMMASTPVPLRFIAKKDLAMVPVIGWSFWWCGVRYIDRKKHDSAVRTLRLAASDMATSRCNYTLAPEGTRRREGLAHELLPFKKGAFHLAMDTGATIVPAALIGVHDLVRRPGAMWPNRGHVTVRFMPPIHVDAEKDNVDELLERCRASMIDGIRQGHAHVDPGWSWREASATLLAAYASVLVAATAVWCARIFVWS